MASDVNLFEVDPESGSVVYVVKDDESEVVVDAGESAAASDQLGDLSVDPEEFPEVDTVLPEEASNPGVLDPFSSGDVVVLSEEAAAAILAASPAGGSIGSSTLDFFDRVVSGLSPDYKYIAYRTSADDSYDAVLYFSRDYSVNDDSIFFSEAVQLDVERLSTGYTNETHYSSSRVNDVTVDFFQSGSVIYYTNVSAGYPVLGGYNQPAGYAPGLTAALIGAAAVVVLAKLMFKR